MGSVAENKRLKTGTTLNSRYEIGASLGEGGFGETYLAMDSARFGSACVVKRLHPSRASSEVAHRLFEREARMLGELEHPRIPKLLAFFELRARFYLVQDFVDGENLQTRLARESRLLESAVQDIVLQVLDVLEYLHSRTPPVIHRDIKPANLIADRTGKIHVIDFGAVREIVEAGSDSGSTGTKIGTPGYASVEQVRGHPVPASDLFALGATALHLISGLEPWEWYDEGRPAWRNRVVCSAQFMDYLEHSLADLPSRFRTPAEARAALVGATSASTSNPPRPAETPDRFGAATAIGSAHDTNFGTDRPGQSAAGSGHVPQTQPSAGTTPHVTQPPSRRQRPFVWAAGGVVVAAGLVVTAMLRTGHSTGTAPAHADSTVSSASVAGAGGTPAGDHCDERSIRTFRTESVFDLHILCPANWTSYRSAEQRATRIMSPTDGTQIWASVWIPASPNESLAQFAERWRDEMQVVLGAVQLAPSDGDGVAMERYSVAGRRFAATGPGSLQIESKAVGGNRFFAWSIAIGTTPQSKATAQEVLASIEYLAPDAASPSAPGQAK